MLRRPAAVHMSDHEPSASEATARAKTISRTEREVSARERERVARAASAAAFDRACAQSGLTNTQIARQWGVCATVVRGVRTGKKCLPLEKIDLLPDSIFNALFRRRLETSAVAIVIDILTGKKVA